MTQEEKEFLINLLNQLSVKPSDPSAVENIQKIQAILQKLKD